MKTVVVTGRRWIASFNGYVVGVIALIILHRMYRENDAQYRMLSRPVSAGAEDSGT